MTDDLTDALARAHAQQQAAQAWASQINGQQARNIAALARVYPHLQPGVATALGASGVDPDSPLAQQTAKLATEHKAKKGWLDRIGDVVSAGVAPVRAQVRWGLAAATAPVEAITGVARTTYGAVQAGMDGGLGAANEYIENNGSLGDLAGQTTLGASVQAAQGNGQSALSDYFGSINPDDKGRGVLGDGWFPGVNSPGARQQKQNARANAPLINGHAFTFGRLAASFTPLDPGTKPYNIVSGIVDAAATIGLDPATYVGGGVGAANRARGVIGAGRTTEVELATRVPDPASAGLVDGIRKTVLPERTAQWIAGPDGSKVSEYLARETDFERMRRATGRKLPVDLLLKLKDADDPVVVKNLIADAVQAGTVRDAPTAAGSARAAVGVDDSVWGTFRANMGKRQPPRWTQATPSSKIDLEDMDDAVEQLDRFQRNAKLPDDVISRNNEALARAGTNGERFEVVRTTMGVIEDSLVSDGLRRRDARRLTRMVTDWSESTRAYYVDEIGNHVTPQATVVNVGGTTHNLASPHLTAELLDRYIPLPDFRDIKRATSALKPLFDTPVLGKGTRALVGLTDFLTTDLFKTFALAIRPAWTVRVVGEEQARMAAAGLTSAFNHPLSYLAWVAGDDAGDPKTAQLIAALVRSTSKAGIGAARKTVGQRGGTDVLGQRFTDLAAEDTTSTVAQALNRGSAGWRDRRVVQTRHWITPARHEEQYPESWLDELTQLAMDPVARSVAREPLPQAQARFWADVDGTRTALAKSGFDGSDGGWDVTTPAGASTYVQSVLDRLTTKTSSHPELLQAVATGRLGGMQMTNGVASNPRAIKLLQELADQGVGPERVKGTIAADRSARDSASVKVAAAYDHGAEFMFNALGAVPTNRLSRSPAFRQFYWQRIGEVAGMADDAGRTKLLDAARAANLPRQQLRQIEKSTTGPAGNLTVEQADLVAKMHALESTRDLLYDLHNRGQVFDALRVIVPFGEAWREVLTRWSKLAVENPLVPYRLNQAIGGAREGGVFYPDPTTGEEMYAYPGGEMLTGLLTGVPVKVEGQAKGLNTVTGAATGILPGVGPVVQWPVSAFLPDNPTFDDVRDMVLPYGETDTGGGHLESMFPAYVSKILTAMGGGSPAQKRQLAGTTRDVMAFLYSTGEYDTSDPDEQARLLRDAQGKAKKLYFLRGLAQSTAPTAPTYEFAVKDTDGHLTAMHLVADEYRKLLEEDPASATEKLLDEYGDAVFLATVGKTTGSVPTTEAANLLGRSHPDLADKFPNVWGLFTDPNSPFDPSESSRQVKAGQRQTITPREALDLAHQRLGAAMYQQYKDQVGPNPSDDQRMWLLQARAQIKQKYPGYAATPKGLGDTERAVDEVVRAATDPVLGQTDAGQGLKLYLQYRDQALQSANAGGLTTFASADAAVGVRMWLRNVADRVISQHPDFEQLWDRVLERELKDDSQGATP